MEEFRNVTMDHLRHEIGESYRRPAEAAARRGETSLDGFHAPHIVEFINRNRFRVLVVIPKQSGRLQRTETHAQSTSSQTTIQNGLHVNQGNVSRRVFAKDIHKVEGKFIAPTKDEERQTTLLVRSKKARMLSRQMPIRL
jgi:hypothetical protein